MPDTDSLLERVRAVERALTDADSLPDLDAVDAERVTALDDRSARLASRVDDLDADLQAVRGYVARLETRDSRTVNREPMSPRRDHVPADFPHPVPDAEPDDTRTGPRSLRERLRGLL